MVQPEYGAFQSLYKLERACELELISVRSAQPVVEIDSYVVDKAAKRTKQVCNTPEHGLHDFLGLIRVAERQGAAFRR
jgi:hypothetical protein